MLETAVESDRSLSFMCVCTEKAVDGSPASLKHFGGLCVWGFFLIFLVLFETEGPELQTVFNT